MLHNNITKVRYVYRLKSCLSIRGLRAYWVIWRPTGSCGGGGGYLVSSPKEIVRRHSYQLKYGHHVNLVTSPMGPTTPTATGPTRSTGPTTPTGPCWDCYGIHWHHLGTDWNHLGTHCSHLRNTLVPFGLTWKSSERSN